MPKAAIYKKGHPLLEEDEIRMTKYVSMTTPSVQSTLSQQPCQSRLGAPVSA
jgi:hypothetical protein